MARTFSLSPCVSVTVSFSQHSPRYFSPSNLAILKKTLSLLSLPLSPGLPSSRSETPPWTSSSSSFLSTEQKYGRKLKPWHKANTPCPRKSKTDTETWEREKKKRTRYRREGRGNKITKERKWCYPRERERKHQRELRDVRKRSKSAKEQRQKKQQQQQQ